MTVKNLIRSAESHSFCPACGADLAIITGSEDARCRNCSLTRFGIAKPTTPVPVARNCQEGADLAIIGQLEQSADPATPLLAAREALGPGGVLYLEIGTGGLWTFPKKSLMLLMERCGFRLIRKLDRKGQRGLYRRY